MHKYILTWDGLSRLHKINNHLQSAAGQIEDFGIGILDAGEISDQLKQKTGVTLWQLPKIFDALREIVKSERKLAEDWDAEHLSNDLQPKFIDISFPPPGEEFQSKNRLIRCPDCEEPSTGQGKYLWCDHCKEYFENLTSIYDHVARAYPCCPECKNTLGHGQPADFPGKLCCGNCKTIFNKPYYIKRLTNAEYQRIYKTTEIGSFHTAVAAEMFGVLTVTRDQYLIAKHESILWLYSTRINNHV